MTDSKPAGPPPHALFRLGALVATPGALRVLQRLNVDPLSLVLRHVNGDYGDLDAEDLEANRIAVAQGFRVFSAYTLTSQVGGTETARIYVITEWDRSVTTVLRPEDY